MSGPQSPSIMETNKHPFNTKSQSPGPGSLQNDSSVEDDTEKAKNQESIDNDKKSDDSDSTLNISRELKSLLALSKEANLLTNISHKRKKDMRDSPRNLSSDTESKKNVKLASESKLFKFPVTAEAELEEQENEDKAQNVPLKVVKRKRDSFSETSNGADAEESNRKTKKAVHGEYKIFKPNKDIFCWRCHREGVNVVCETCPRSYHQKCLKQTILDVEHWPCPECVAILKAESTQTRSASMKGMTLEHLCSLLKFAVTRMMQCHGSEPFLHPVNVKEFPEYKKFIIQPMDLTMLEKNIKENLYGSTQAFEADAKWLLHNSIIFNSYQSKLTSAAKTMIKICKQEMMEIENCPSCYLKANTNKSTWFVEVCPKPHILVWAKLKGFPYWPAKAMSISRSGLVDVRFFGAHDRAWVHYKECYLYSEKDPNTFKQKRFDIEKCVEELNLYIDNLRKIYGEFRYAPYRTLLDSEDIYRQLTIFLPKYKSVQSRRKSYRDSTEIAPKEQSESSIRDETIKEPEKSEDTSFTHSSINSPFQDHETTMEGYGTDDDMQSEIDHESRKAFAGNKSTINDKTEDEDDEDDTQVPSNISVESTLPIDQVRTRGSFNNSTGKLKMPGLSLEISQPDEIPSASQKTSRRNSDQSIKSDTSHVSNISDKINRVNISENMEITLGNEDVGCVRISENISPLVSEHSRSGSEQSYEIKKKPVQVDIENAEFSISPNKVKISDQLIKRLTDIKQVDEVKKSLEYHEKEPKNKPSTSKPKKQPKIAVNGDVGSLLDQKNEVSTLLKNDSIEEKSKLKTIQPSITEYMSVVSKTPEVPETQPLGSKDGSLEKTTVSDSPSNLISKKGNLNTTQILSPPLELSSENQNDISLKKSVVLKETVSAKVIQTTEIEKEVCTQSSENQLTESMILEQVLDLEKQSSNKSVNPEKISDVSIVKNIPNTDDFNKSISPSQETSDNKKIADKSIENEESQIIATSENKTDPKQTSQPILKEVNTTSEKNKIPLDLVDIIEEFDDDEDLDIIEKITFDKKKIFDVIHSSLKQVDTESINNTDVSNKEKEISTSGSEQEKESTIKEKESNESLLENEKELTNNKIETSKFGSDKIITTKKRKLNSDETNSPAKIVKLVSIESILNNENKDDEMENVKDAPEKPGEDIEPNISPEDIKSEHGSGDELMDDSGQLEEKRKYLSALNIHEKTTECEKKDTNEIRTRSKAEEKRERFKVVDNLTRIIDDVAMNYSALHEGEKIPPRKPERRKSNSGVPIHEGEIHVKSFAKLSTPPSGKQRARKTFPIPVYIKQTLKSPMPKKDISILRREQPTQKILNSLVAAKPLPERTPVSSPISSSKNIPSVSIPPSVPKSFSIAQSTSGILTPQATSGITIQSSIGPPYSVVASSHPNVCTTSSIAPGLSTTSTASQQSLAMGHVILVPGAAVNYYPPISNPGVNTVPHSNVSITSSSNSQTKPSVLKKMPSLNLRTSQNYIPHDDTESSASPSPISVINHSLNENSTPQKPQEVSETPVPSTSSCSTSLNTNTSNINNNTNPPTSASIEQEDEFAILNGLVPESVSRAVSELLLRPPPRLKPRPPGITSQNYDEGIPSTAGDVTAKINSIAHRMTDYFRGMLIETLEDIGKSTTPEAKIAGLQLEMEALKHRHSLEMAEMRKNMCTILKDIQRSIVEERDKIVDETRAACETETIRRVELAKSKQWCANCPKEAQFYCCWNTSYCDYPCQQKHWPQHAGKCTQSIEKATGTGAMPPPRPTGQPIVLRPALTAPKPMGRIIAKPAKVYMNKANVPQKTVKTVQTSGLTLVETTPGNYELVGNGSVGLTGKIYTTSATLSSTKYKPTSSIATPLRPTEQSRQATSSSNKPQYII